MNGKAAPHHGAAFLLNRLRCPSRYGCHDASGRFVARKLAASERFNIGPVSENATADSVLARADTEPLPLRHRFRRAVKRECQILAIDRPATIVAAWQYPDLTFSICW